ncbi:S-adenosyl-L-methionine-dependent methyltransferase [Aspergillus pseudonomiae]|nr:S-adenosyl-L-methionine-dependent methyltransferase [Aspergillus pseudonomiae]
MAEQFQVTTNPEIEPDLYYDVQCLDSDSTYNDSLGSESYRTSVTLSNGRRYYAYREGKYTLPNNEEEQDQMDLFHHIYSLILDGEIHVAPIKNAQRVLDIGTGTGIWAVDFADQYAFSEVIGNDLSPIQPKWVPPNCQFEIDDLNQNGQLGGSIHDFPRPCRQAFSHLCPGEYFEIQSFTVDIFSDDSSIEKAPYTKQVVSLFQEASARFGKPMNNLDTWPAAMKESGFTDVVCKIVKASSIHSVPAYTNILLSRVLGWDKTEIDILNMHVLRESKNLEVHQYGKLYLIYGRKAL